MSDKLDQLLRSVTHHLENEGVSFFIVLDQNKENVGAMSADAEFRMNLTQRIVDEPAFNRLLQPTEEFNTATLAYIQGDEAPVDSLLAALKAERQR